MIDDLNKKELEDIRKKSDELLTKLRLLIQSFMSGSIDRKTVNANLKECRKRRLILNKRLKAIGIK